jgi:hypothetical protein
MFHLFYELHLAVLGLCEVHVQAQLEEVAERQLLNRDILKRAT